MSQPQDLVIDPLAAATSKVAAAAVKSAQPATGPDEDADGMHELHDAAFEHIGIGTKIVKATIIFLPLIGLLVAMYLLWGYGVGWTEVALLVGMYFLTGMGITIGYHRYYTHKSFECTRPVQWFIAIAGSMAMQGDLNGWCAVHRSHHQHSDRPGDPHSPHVDHHDEHTFGNGIVGTLKGVWHSHMGWLFVDDRAGLQKYIPDLAEHPVAKPVSKLFGVWVLLGLAIPALIGGLISMTWWGALLGFLWGGLVRIHLIHHITWSINSACHLWGQRTYKSHDHSRNNFIFGWLAFGEGWHNNHHAFPASARHGLEWWQFDSSWVVISTLKKLGLAWDLNLPKPERMAAKRTNPAPVTAKA